MTNLTPISDSPDEHARALDRRLEEGAWGIFLIMIGVLWLIPKTRVPEDFWLLGAGVIMLGLNAARSFNHLRMRALTLVLGIAAVIAGLASSLGFDLPIFALLIIILGAALLVRQLLPHPTTPHALSR